MECERGTPEAMLSTSRDLASAYAEILRAVESPLPISSYAQSLLLSSEVSAVKTALTTILGFALLVGICVIAFRPPLSRIIDESLFILIFVIAFSFFASKFSRRVIWPVVIRILTIDYIVKVMVHHHIRRHLNTLARQYSAKALALPTEVELRKPLSETSEAYRKMAEQLQGVRSIIYISAPPILISMLSQLNLNWKQIFSVAPVWMISLAYIYIFYLMIVCFSRKREIFKGDAMWLSPNLDVQIYELENIAYDAICVSKKRELPLDLLLMIGNGVALVGLTLWLLLYGSGAGSGIVAGLGGGRFADSVIPLLGGVFCLWLSISQWKLRAEVALA